MLAKYDVCVYEMYVCIEVALSRGSDGGGLGQVSVGTVFICFPWQRRRSILDMVHAEDLHCSDVVFVPLRDEESRQRNELLNEEQRVVVEKWYPILLVIFPFMAEVVAVLEGQLQ